MDAATSTALAWGPFVLDPEARTFRRDGQLVELQPLTFRLLAVLAHHRGRAVSREHLVQELWPDTRVVDNALFQLVRRARSALADDATPRRLLAVPRFGYRLVDEPVARADRRGLVGRGVELEQVRARLAADRVAVVTGLGGVGKTLLAEVVAAGWPDRRWVSLGGRSSLDDALAYVASTLGAAGPGAIGAALRGAGGGLLVLDECEDVGPALGEHVRAWVAGSEVVVLATSRVALDGLPSVPLGPLPPADARALFGRDAAPGVATDPAVGPILERLEGYPLAIVLAARRTRAVAPRDLLALLARPFATLADPASTGRQRAVGDVLAWAWETSTPEERAAWEVLSVFAGGAALPDAVATAEAADVPGFLPDALPRLVDTGVLGFDAARGRYHQLELVRRWGQQQLAREPARDDRVRRAHAAVFAARGDAAAMRTFRSRSGPALLAWAVAERANLEAAFEGAVRRGTGAEAAGTALLLMHVAELHGPVRAGADRLAAARPLPGAEPRLRELLSAEAGLRRYVGEREVAAALSLQAEVVAVASGSPADLAIARANLGSLRLESGEVAAGEALLREALAIQLTVDPAGAGATQCTLGRARELCGDLDGAVAAWRAADLRLRVYGSPRLEAINLAMLGRLLGRTGHAAEGIRTLRRALALHREVGDTISEGWTLGSLGAAHADQGQSEAALVAFGEQLALARATGQVRLEAVALEARGVARWAGGALEDAEQDLVAAVASHAATGAARSQATATVSLGVVCAALGDGPRARALFEEAAAVAAALGARDTVAHARLEAAALERGAPGAVDAVDAVLAELEELSDCGASARGWALRAELTGRVEDLDRARSWAAKQGGGPGARHHRAVAAAAVLLGRGA